MSGPTKTEMAERLAVQQAKVQSLDERLRSIDDEARALAACVTALDTLGKQSRPGTWGGRPSADKTRRILRYLADRYGVTWYEPPIENRLSDAEYLT